MTNSTPNFSHILMRFAAAKAARAEWESLWQDCYDYALPQRGSGSFRRSERLYDATALDAVDQLSSLILAHVAPPLTPWFGFKAGTDLNDEQAAKITPALEKATRIMQAHFDQSNFTVEIHQCFLDLVVAGTASLSFEEAEPGRLSAFQFRALPLDHVILGENESGRLDHVYRTLHLTPSAILERYGANEMIAALLAKNNEPLDIAEAVIPHTTDHGYTLYAFYNDILLAEQPLNASPYINFRWMKSPGEIYGRSPVMKTLPDIKTANKVVELILKNASIAVTGIWQAEDDGVLNPATIELVPGAIIPKAMGSKGLTPLEMPARFDVSQLVLESLRERIRSALLVDRIPSGKERPRTATEILERSAQMALLLGATFGRLQVELLNPLIMRAYSILQRRGVLPDLPLDGRSVAIDYRSPLAQSQSIHQADAIASWLQSMSGLGAEVTQQIDKSALAAYLAEMLGIPSFLTQPTQPSAGE
ncbi:MAG: portal protein [Pseudobdellovibrionaceae bacterium]